MAIALSRSPLRGQSGRFGQHDKMLIAPQDRVLNHLFILIRDRRGALRDLNECFHRGCIGQGRDADLLARLDPGRALDATSVDANLPGAAQLFDSPLRQLRKALFHPAIKTLIALVLADLHHLNIAHANTPLPSANPATIAPSDNATVRKT